MTRPLSLGRSLLIVGAATALMLTPLVLTPILLTFSLPAAAADPAAPATDVPATNDPLRPPPGLFASDDFKNPKPPESPAPTLTHPEVGKVFNEAKALLNDKKDAEALAKLQEADAIADQTPYEKGLLAQIAIIGALRTNNTVVAIKALANLPASVPVAQRMNYVAAIMTNCFNGKDYPATIEWARLLLDMGDTQRELALKLLGRSSYFTKDYAGAITYEKQAMDDQERSGKVPAEVDLEVLQDSALKVKDTENYGLALTKLVTNYPSPERWNDLIYQRTDRASFPREKRALDVFRLLAATGGMKQPSQIIEYAQTALEAGYPGEAKRALDLGPAGTGDAALRARVTHDVDVDQKSLAKVQSDAEKASNGTVLVKLGVDYYGYGQYDKAISLIEEGIAKGGLKSPDDALLSLGVAYLAAGQKDKALETLRKITQTGGPLEIAQVWILKATIAEQ